MSDLINFCTKCGSNLRKQKSFSSYKNVHVCEVCGQELLNPNSESDLIWHCNKCGVILNNQPEWCDGDGLYQCSKCGAYNDLDDPDSEEYWEDDDLIEEVNEENIKEIFDSLTEVQKTVVCYFIGQLIEDIKNNEVEKGDIENLGDFEEYFNLSPDYEPSEDDEEKTVQEVYYELTELQQEMLFYLIKKVFNDIQAEEYDDNSDEEDYDEDSDNEYYEEEDDDIEYDEENSKEEQDDIVLCPVCRTEISNWQHQVTNNHFIQCPQCGKRYYDPKIYSGEKFKGVYWHCKGCNSLLNIQKNFNDINGFWFCSECGFKNIINESNIENNGYCKNKKHYKK